MRTNLYLDSIKFKMCPKKLDHIYQDTLEINMEGIEGSEFLS